MPGLIRKLPRRLATLFGSPRPTQQPFDVSGIDQRHDQWVMLIDLRQLAMLVRIVAGADQGREFARLLQTTEKKIGDQRRGVRHQRGLVVAPLLGSPDEILRVLEALGELTVDQFGNGTAPQYRRFLANGAIALAKLECATV